MSRQRFLFLLAVAVLLPNARAGCVAPYFQQLPVNSRATLSVVAADFDRDGKPDVAGLTADAVYVLRNTGGGAFAAAADVYSGAAIGSLVTADFNGDGRADLAFAKEGALIVLPGKGDGTFDAPVESAIAVKPAALVAARFDPDAATDLAAVDASAAMLVTYRNDGAGRFTELQSAAIGPAATAIDAADFDVDGRTDVAIGYRDGFNLDLLYGRAGGTLDPAVKVVGYPGVTVVRAADMDGNGLPDLTLGRSVGSFTIILNLGARAFANPFGYLAYRTPTFTGMAAVDLTRDGKLDLVGSVACGVRTSTGSSSGASVYQWYADQRNCVMNSSRGGLAAADYDGDGRVDVLAAMVREPQAASAVVLFRSICGESAVSLVNDTPTVSAGQTLTWPVSIAPSAPQDYWLTPTGEVTLRDGDRAIETKPLGELGRASFTIENPAAGDHTFYLDYSGDPQYDAGTSAPVPLRVVNATTTVTLTADPPAGVYGSVPRLTATVDGGLTGSIRFTVDGRTRESWKGSAPQFSIVSEAGSVGDHLFVAEYLGDATHPAGKATLAYTVVKQAPLFEAFTTFATMPTLNKELVIKATVKNTTEQIQGPLTLRIGDTLAGTINTTGFNFQHFSMPALAAGRHWLRVSFGGDAHFAAVDNILPFVVYAPSPKLTDARGSASGILVTWGDQFGVSFARKQGLGAWDYRRCCLPPPLMDETFPQPETVYLYRAEDYDRTGLSLADVAMIFPFTDDPLMPESSVSATHVAEIVRAVNLLRAAAGLAAVELPPLPPAAPGRHRVAGSRAAIPAASVQLLRDAINEARERLGAYRYDFTTPLGPANAVSIQELREAVR